MTAAVRWDVPVAPDGPTGQRWAIEELSHPEYREKRSLLSRLIESVLARFDGLSAHGFSGLQAALVVVGITVVVVVVAFLVAGPVRRARRVRSTGSVLAEDDVRSAEQLREAADAAARAGDFSLAVVERFRALVRGLEERLVLDERAGRTAHEASLDAGRRLPALGTELAAAGVLFDDVAYGGRTAHADDDQRLRALDERARHERPATVDAR